MKVTTYGTAGSLPTCRPERTEHGGNTTCLRIHSDCIPEGTALVIDAGTGYFPMCRDLFKERIGEVVTLFTHYHHDHTQGMLLVPHTYMEQIRMELIGPAENGFGPKEVFEHLMKPPFHPVDFTEVKSHFTFKGLEHPAAHIILFHPQGGKRVMEVDSFKQLTNAGKHIPIGKGKYPVDECLVIRMHRSTHPERTITYRFEERPTGKVFVLLTDHESMDGHPVSLVRHVGGADLLIIDAQYDEVTYHERTAGFGHGTGSYAARLAEKCDTKRVGITHHDPSADDQGIKKILEEACAECTNPDIEFFSCRDLMTIEV